MVHLLSGTCRLGKWRITLAGSATSFPFFPGLLSHRVNLEGVSPLFAHSNHPVFSIRLLSNENHKQKVPRFTAERKEN